MRLPIGGGRETHLELGAREGEEHQGVPHVLKGPSYYGLRCFALIVLPGGDTNNTPPCFTEGAAPSKIFTIKNDVLHYEIVSNY